MRIVKGDKVKYLNLEEHIKEHNEKLLSRGHKFID